MLTMQKLAGDFQYIFSQHDLLIIKPFLMRKSDGSTPSYGKRLGLNPASIFTRESSYNCFSAS